MRIDIGYGNGTQTLDIPDARVLDVLYPNRVENTLRGEAEAEDARAVCRQLGVPFHLFSWQDAFRNTVEADFCRQ